jgi:HSP20 family protein
MAIVKWSPHTLSPAWRPFAEFDTLRREIDRVFNTFWPFGGSGAASNERMWTPPVDCMEKDDEYVLHAELPGMKLDDIHMQFHEGMLILQGERKLEHETHNGYDHRERAYGAFSRSFMIGPAVEADQISATYKDGILEVHVPKTAEAKPKRIMIQAA